MSSGVQLQKATSYGAAIDLPKDGKLLPMDLLEEYWFFNNTLDARKVSPRPPKAPQSNRIDESVAGQPLLRKPSIPPPRVPPSETSDSEVGNEDDEVLPVPLMGTPSMPSSYSNGFDDADHKETQLNSNKKSKASKLRHSSSTLGCHHSWHSSFEKVAARPSLTRQHSSMPSRKYCLYHNYYHSSDTHYRVFQDEKWKSSSDLESIEVQGFKDLGFSFDKEELKESLANVIPGLREKKQEQEREEKITRPYLSEAWYVGRSVPPSFNWTEKKSTAEMKDRLRFWARAVACNVRQES